jgi:hypothetical protein
VTAALPKKSAIRIKINQRVKARPLRRRASCGAGRVALWAGRVVVLVAALTASICAAGEYTILGAGSRPCGSWLQARSQVSPEGAVMQSWLLGYITSINAHELSITKDIAEGTKPDAMFAWIDDYCASHPLDSVARAAASLTGVLRSSSQAH